MTASDTPAPPSAPSREEALALAAYMDDVAESALYADDTARCQEIAAVLRRHDALAAEAERLNDRIADLEEWGEASANEIVLRERDRWRGRAEAAEAEVACLHAEVAGALDRGRRDMLNDLLALNPDVEAKLAALHEREPDPLGRIPFDVAFWVTTVASQLGIEPKNDPDAALASQSQGGEHGE